MPIISEIKEVEIFHVDQCAQIENPFYVRWVGPYSWEYWLFHSKQVYGGNVSQVGTATLNYDSIQKGTQRVSKPLSRQAVQTVELFAYNLTEQQMRGLETMYEAIRAQRWIGPGEDHWEDIEIPTGQYTLLDNQGAVHDFKIKINLQPQYTKVS